MGTKRSKNIFRYLNLTGYVVIILFVVVIIVKAVSFGHPWSLACYVCKKCTPVCIMGIDPSQLLLAANLNDPNLYITTDNLRMKAKDAWAIDSNMTVRYNEQDFNLAYALNEKIFSENEIIMTSKIRAKDAARFCMKCKACSNECPFNLPIVEVVDELRKSEINAEN